MARTGGFGNPILTSTGPSSGGTMSSNTLNGTAIPSSTKSAVIIT